MSSLQEEVSRERIRKQQMEEGELLVEK